MKSIDDACMSYRHDFGLMCDERQRELRYEAREWLRAFHLEDHDLRVIGDEYPVIENVLWRYLLGANKIMMKSLGKEAEQKWHDELMAYIKTLPDDDD
jgi:hypothetical protein